MATENTSYQGVNPHMFYVLCTIYPHFFAATNCSNQPVHCRRCEAAQDLDHAAFWNEERTASVA